MSKKSYPKPQGRNAPIKAVTSPKRSDPPWTPFERATPLENLQLPESARAMMREHEIYVNSRYQVMIRGVNVSMIHMSIRRLDRGPIHDWRDLQRIKNELVGPEYEAVELYPAESRLVDTSNQYSLWVVMDITYRFPFGWNERLVAYGDDPTLGTKQRPFEDHVLDAKGPEEMREKLRSTYE